MHHVTRRWISRALTVALSLTGLCSCKTELYQHLEERDANEMLEVLYFSGIQAEKDTRDEKTWAVEVERKDLPAALRTVAAHGLPREQFASVGDLFKKEGLVSTPSEERIRYIYAVSQELANTLSQIDGVMVARVHPVIPANDPLATQLRPSSASVFIKYRQDADVQALAPPIKNLIMRSIEGLQYENISLTFVPAHGTTRPLTTPASAKPAALTGRTPAKSVLGGTGVLLILAISGLGLVRKRRWPGWLGMRSRLTLEPRFWTARVR